MRLASKFKEAVSRKLSGTRAFAPIQGIYQAVFNREWAKIRVERNKFYRQFVGSDSLVFDIGANQGEFTDTFLRLGARVVAVEPNPDCCKQIRALGHGDRLTIRCEAIGDRQGEVTLFVGDHSGHSTVSKEWMREVSQKDAGYRWSKTIMTQLNTLDQIQLEHGTPDFIKIDVEGNEANVLSRMSFKPRALSFEFHAFAIEKVQDCLSRLVFDSECNFNITIGDKWEFVWPDWRNRDAVIGCISSLPSETFGDIYATFAY
jgi:FkbM family methyltransferase